MIWHNIASFEKTSSIEVKIWAKFNAKINSALMFFHNYDLTTASFLRKSNIISHLFAS